MPSSIRIRPLGSDLHVVPAWTSTRPQSPDVHLSSLKLQFIPARTRTSSIAIRPHPRRSVGVRPSLALLDCRPRVCPTAIPIRGLVGPTRRMRPHRPQMPLFSGIAAHHLAQAMVLPEPNVASYGLASQLRPDARHACLGRWLRWMPWLSETSSWSSQCAAAATATSKWQCPGV